MPSRRTFLKTLAAAGAVAAIAVATKRWPHEVSWEEGRLAVARARDVGRRETPDPG